MDALDLPAAKPRGRRKRAVSVLDTYEIDRAIARQIKLRRMKLGLSQTELGDKIGVSFQQIQKYEHGASQVSASTLFELAVVLKCPVREFYDPEGAPSEDDYIRDQIGVGPLRVARDLSHISDMKVRSALSRLVHALADSTAD